MMVEPLAFVGVAGAPVIVALVQRGKEVFPSVPGRFWPAVVLLLAIALNLWLAALLGTPLGLGALTGLVTGLTASGLYSWSRAGSAER